MSFILKALKKVERQHAEAKSGQVANRTARRELKHRWPWVIALLLTAGAMLSVGILLGRSEKPVQKVSSQWQAVERPSTKQTPASIVKPIQATPQKRVVVETAVPETISKVEEPVLANTAEVQPVPQQQKITPDMLGDIPRSLPAMNIDIHSVSQTNPAKSYVMINMQRYRIGDRTHEGAVVADIVTDGAILEYQSRYFLLPLH